MRRRSRSARFAALRRFRYARLAALRCSRSARLAALRHSRSRSVRRFCFGGALAPLGSPPWRGAPACSVHRFGAALSLAPGSPRCGGALAPARLAAFVAPLPLRSARRVAAALPLTLGSPLRCGGALAPLGSPLRGCGALAHARLSVRPLSGRILP